MIGLFLSLLELIRQKRIRACQEYPFGPISIQLLDASPIHVDEDAFSEPPTEVGAHDGTDTATPSTQRPEEQAEPGLDENSFDGTEDDLHALGDDQADPWSADPNPQSDPPLTSRSDVKGIRNPQSKFSESPDVPH